MPWRKRKQFSNTKSIVKVEAGIVTLINKRMECTNLVDPPSAVVPLIYCRIRTILPIYPRQPVPKTDCQLSRRSILDSLSSLANVSFDDQSSFFPWFVKYGSIVAKD
jgi:hypothetical protein